MTRPVAVARRGSRSSSTGEPAHARAARRGIDAVGVPPRAELARLRRDELAHGASEKRAVIAYLRGLKRAGASLPRLPPRFLGGRERSVKQEVAPMRAAPRGAIASLPGLAELDLDQALPWRASTVALPFDYSWTWTKWIHYAPGVLSAHANQVAGALGVELASDHDSNQVNKSRARAGIGVRYQPSERGTLRIQQRIHLTYEGRVKAKMRSARAYGWTGLLVQAFDPSDDRLVGTPIDHRHSRFDLHDSGMVTLPLPSAEFPVTLPAAPLPSLIVDPGLWYAIWLWCGGGIRAAGWQTVAGMNLGSDAAAKIDVRVDSITLYFTPIGALTGSG